MLKLADDLKLPIDVVTQTIATRAERIWASGLFEGEGTITIAKRSRDDTYRLVCIVGSTDLQIVNFFHQRWGGWHQPFYGERPGRKRAWQWTVAGPAAHAFLLSIQPFLVTVRVRRKLQLALDFRREQSRLKSVWSKPEYKAQQRLAYEEMKKLNKRGVAA